MLVFPTCVHWYAKSGFLDCFDIHVHVHVFMGSVMSFSSTFPQMLANPLSEVMLCKYVMSYLTVPGKTDHFVIISDFELLVPRCSALFTLCNGEVRIAIAYTVLE